MTYSLQSPVTIKSESTCDMQGLIQKQQYRNRQAVPVLQESTNPRGAVELLERKSQPTASGFDLGEAQLNRRLPVLVDVDEAVKLTSRQARS